MIRPVRLDRYVCDVLMRDLVGHDQQPSAYLVYLCLTRLAGGGRRPRARASLAQLAGETGLSKRAVQTAVRHLLRRHLLRADRAHATAVPFYEVLRPWRRPRTQNGGAARRPVVATPRPMRRLAPA